jgi:hypothetical protein
LACKPASLIPGRIVPHFDEIPAAFVKTVHYLAARVKTVVGIAETRHW